MIIDMTRIKMERKTGIIVALASGYAIYKYIIFQETSNCFLRCLKTVTSSSHIILV
jgi:hypothetical protein